MDDRADLDGDGTYDGIDISIMKGDKGTRQPSSNGGCGCCVVLLVLGSVLGAGWWGVSHYLA